VIEDGCGDAEITTRSSNEDTLADIIMEMPSKLSAAQQAINAGRERKKKQLMTLLSPSKKESDANVKNVYYLQICQNLLSKRNCNYIS
jgi:hypothetical protein